MRELVAPGKFTIHASAVLPPGISNVLVDVVERKWSWSDTVHAEITSPPSLGIASPLACRVMVPVAFMILALNTVRTMTSLPGT